MDLWERYLQAFSKELGQIAVWPPGDKMQLGDYGEFKDGNFSHLGNVFSRSEFGLSDRTVWKTSVVRFKGTQRLSGQMSITGSGGAGMGSVGVGVEARLGKGSVLFVVEFNGETRRLEEPEALARHIRAKMRLDWFQNHVVVIRVHQAERFHVALCADTSAQASAKASSSAIEALVGALDVKGSVDVQGCDLFHNRQGPMTIGVVGFKKIWFKDARIKMYIEGTLPEPEVFDAEEVVEELLRKSS